MDGVREEDVIGGDVRRNGSGKEGVEDVGGGYGVGVGSGDVGAAGECEEVARGSLIGREGEEERVVGGCGARIDSE